MKMPEELDPLTKELAHAIDLQRNYTSAGIDQPSPNAIHDAGELITIFGAHYSHLENIGHFVGFLKNAGARVIWADEDSPSLLTVMIGGKEFRIKVLPKSSEPS